MPKLNIKEVMTREAKAQTRKDEWRSIYEDCYEFALPQRNLYNGYYEGKTPGKNKMQRVFDSTAMNSTKRFANRLQSGLFPPNRQWCRLQPGSAIPEQDRPRAQQALDAYADIMFDQLAQTSFDLAMGEFLLDLCVGTAVMMVMPGDEVTPIRFLAIPQYLVAIEEGANGIVDNVYRKLRIKAEAIQREYPDVQITPELEDCMQYKPGEELDLFDAIIFDQETGRYHYHVVWPAKQQELVYREMDSSPFVVARFSKTAGEVYGRGPLVDAIPDIKTLNKTVELVLKNASLAISGVFLAADDGVLNPQTVKIQPGAIIPVARNGGPQGASLAPLPRAGDFNTSQIVMQDLRVNIKKILMDDTLPPDTMSARSATEIAQRQRELATNLGSAFGRLMTEIMIPLVSRILFVLDRQGLIQMPLKVNGVQVKVTPISPLAEAPKMEEVNQLLNFMQIAGSMGPMGQSIINIPESIAFIAEKMGIDQRVLNTPEEQQMMMQQMQQQMMAEQQPMPTDEITAEAMQ
jgi:hypothetical protein